MIKVMNSWQELEDARAWLHTQDIDFTDPSKARLWRWLFAARFRVPAPTTDKLKSWDVANMVQCIERSFPDRSSAVLDLGCFNSEILWALKARGYRDLHGCDLNPLCKWMPYWNAIHYKCADMTQTGYEPGQFHVLTAVSAIEHGVPIAALAREAARLLKPGGIFLVTTDYDSSGVTHDTRSELIFGQTWRIFDRPGLESVIDELRANGLELMNHVDDADWRHELTPITWSEQKYTFAFLAFRRV